MYKTRDGKTVCLYFPCEWDRNSPPTGEVMENLKAGQKVWRGDKIIMKKAAGQIVYYEIFDFHSEKYLGRACERSLWTKKRAQQDKVGLIQVMIALGDPLDILK